MPARVIGSFFRPVCPLSHNTACGRQAHGAMITLVPLGGSLPSPSTLSGTSSSHPSSCDERVEAEDEYQEPA